LPLADSRLAFAKYLNHLHARIHPVFADQFLKSVETLPQDDPLRNPALTTEVALVVGGDTGRLESAKVTQSSENPQFDAAALDAATRAFPSEPPEKSCWSSDGKVYVLWIFRQAPEACGTWNARPFKLSF
jgi:TonB family protein